ncbi:MAG: tRNA pseudouridine(38-40) synthase TruA [Candidatus Endonucleobacter bathymodioli]|uniref:tRNA pseudouridine synthase A n=1 Tax=Candidatus Endonucleibacter bathymodioli TaxID=539814 RepID=A0AA90SMJ1_9GAMM|nr:tRNA pseudouridine(38-40) synthase TruA [Candidatus Endonucleobacter bathymodioli]
MLHYAASIQYDGAGYHGWQSLKSGLPSVQTELERALSKVANSSTKVICAGRTDAGVHGCSQIVHFDTDAERSNRSWTYGVNANLPDTIAVNWVQSVSDDFHARFSALWRRYRYIIYNHNIRPTHLPKGLTWNYWPLDEVRMQEAARYLVGEHDFNSYRSARCQAKNPKRTIHHLSINRYRRLVVIDIKANAFLQHMVRNIAGVLMEIGCGKREPIWAKDVLDGRDRKLGGVTSAPWGLYFVDVGYPEKFGLPCTVLGPEFIASLLCADT